MLTKLQQGLDERVLAWASEKSSYSTLEDLVSARAVENQGAVTGRAGRTCVEVTQRSESSQPTHLLPTPPKLVTGHHNTAGQIPTSPPSWLPTEKLRKAASYGPLPHFCLQILPECTELAEFSSHPSCKGV